MPKLLLLAAFFALFRADVLLGKDADLSLVQLEVKSLSCSIEKLDKEYLDSYKSFVLFSENLSDYADNKSGKSSDLIADFLKSYPGLRRKGRNSYTLSMQKYSDFFVSYLKDTWIEKISILFRQGVEELYESRRILKNLVTQDYTQQNSVTTKFDSYLDCINRHSESINAKHLSSLYKSGELPELIANVSSSIQKIEKVNDELEDSMYNLRHFINQLRYDASDGFVLELVAEHQESEDRSSDQLSVAVASVKYFAKYINLYWLNSVNIDLLNSSNALYAINNILNNITSHLYGITPNAQKWRDDLSKTSPGYYLHESTTLTATPIATLPEHQQSESSQNDRKSYDAAFSLMQGGNLAGAVTAFEALIAAFPNSALLTNAYYWLSEISYSLKEFDKAYKYAEFAYDNNRKSVKGLLSGLKMAASLEKMGNMDKACEVLLQVHGQVDHTNTSDYMATTITNKITQLECGH